MIAFGWIVLALVAVLVVATLLTTDWLASFGGSPARPTPFQNTYPVTVMAQGGSTLSVMPEFFFGGAKRRPSGTVPLAHDTAARLATPPASGLRVTWLGHSTLLIEIDGRRLLTDPIWSRRASPSTLVGPERFHPPPLPLAEIGRIDAVLVSHDHYDHMDMATLRALAPRGMPFYVATGVGTHLRRWGVPEGQIIELAWWEERQLDPLRIIATPAQHFSGRNPLLRDRTLWTSWTLIGPQHRAFFSGDTGLTPELAEIGARFGPFDATMLEIGAFHELWSDIHLGPRKAVAAHQMLRGKVLFPVHWATFDLGLHPWAEPADDVVKEAAAQGVPFIMPKLGAPTEPAQPPPLEYWWRNLR